MTNVVKGAGRARHKANERHQQRTPLPPRTSGLESLLPTPKAKARAIVKEEAEQLVAGTKLSKAQELAMAAEEAGWEVERVVAGTHKTLIARRGEETLEAHWDNDRSCIPLGWHEVAGRRAKFQHVTVAKKIIATPADVAAANAATAATARKAPATVTHRTLAQGVPFNPASATDEEVLTAILGREITWRNVMSNGELTGLAVVPLEGKQTRLDVDDFDSPETRQLTFCDASGEGGYYTIRLSQLTSVGALVDEGGRMMTNTKHMAMNAMREGNKK